jgi:hypothetical protein
MGQGAGFLVRAVGLMGEEDPQHGYDRLVLTPALEIRPFGFSPASDRDSWAQRAVRRLAVEAGLGIERVNAGAQSATRAGLHLGAHADLPLGGQGDRGMFVRLALSRRLGLFGDSTIAGVAARGAARCELVDTLVEYFVLVGAAF